MQQPNRIFKAGLGYAIANYLTKGLVFLTIPLFTRLLSTSEYGLFSTYHAYETILASFVGMALFMSLKNAKYKYINQYPSYVSSLLLISIFSFVLWEFFCLLLYPLYGKIIEFSLPVILILVLNCFCSTVLSFYNVHISLSYSYKSYIIIAFLNSLGNIVISIILILTICNNNRFLGRVLGTIIPLIPISIWVIYYFWNHTKPKINFDYWRFGLKYSLPLVPHAASQVILNQFDRIMIRTMVDASCAGIYSFAYNLNLIIEVTKYSLDNVWSAWFYEKYNEKDYQSIKQGSSKYILLMFCFVSVLILVSPELIKIIGPSEYSDAKYIVAPICVAGFFSFLYLLPAQVEYYHEKTFYISLGTIIAAIINITLNYIFIKKYGYIAAAYTTELTYILFFVLHYCIAKRISPHALFSTPHFIIVSISCIAIGIISTVWVNYWLLRWFLILPIIILSIIRLDAIQYIRNYWRNK